MNLFVIIPASNSVDQLVVEDGMVMPINTDAEAEAAREAMRDRGIDQLPVYSNYSDEVDSQDDENYLTNLKLVV